MPNPTRYLPRSGFSIVDEVVYWLRQRGGGGPLIISGPQIAGGQTRLSRGMVFDRRGMLHAPRMLLYVTRPNVVFQQQSRGGPLFTQVSTSFALDVSGIAASYTSGAIGAQGMAMLAEAEMEFLRTALNAYPPVRFANLGINILRFSNMVWRNQHRAPLLLTAIQQLYISIDWMRTNTPHTFNYLCVAGASAFGLALLRAPQTLDHRGVAAILGTFVGGMSKSVLQQQTLVALRALRAALQATPVAAVTSGVRRVRSNNASAAHSGRVQAIIAQLRQQGVNQQNAAQIAQEFANNSAVQQHLDTFQNSLETIANNLEGPIRQDLNRVASMSTI
jgi:hypothetical protein